MKPIRIMAAAYPAPRARPGSCERRRPGGPVYGPRERASLIAFNRAGTDPFTVVKRLDQRGVEARAGCHCATLAHHALRLDPPAELRGLQQRGGRRPRGRRGGLRAVRRIA
ncbi:aminotransferase class V-fold PLP-dependent enzyme [Actinoplanes sp. NPDC051343]|uniref:aminotransferase class V-fold PLP-dependent enzyme n=1 Tax=Actinoplanes sp. NPDC051343 TaxID=3363906 RepID=UPI00378A57C5